MSIALYSDSNHCFIEGLGNHPHLSSPAHAVKEERNVPVSLLTLSNQDKEPHKEAVLCACRQSEQDPPVLVPTQLTVWALPVAAYTTKKTKWWKILKKKRGKEGYHEKKTGVVCVVSLWCGEEEGIANCKTDSKLAKMTTMLAAA